jgi:hypothetical protein
MMSRLEEHSSSLSAVRMMCHPVRTPDSPASSVRTTCFFRPDTYVVSRSFCTNLLRPDVSAARPDAYQFLNGSLILSKFQEREDQATIRTMWYTVWTRISVRQESQFEFHCPNAWQLWSGRWCIVYGNWRFDFNRPDVSPLWSGRTRIRYGNCVLKFSRPNAPTPWSERAKPVMEITLQRTCVRLDDRATPSGRCSYTGKIFPQKFWKILSHSCPSERLWSTIRTAHRLILPDAHSDPQIINRGPWALRAARIRCEFH